MKTNTHLACRYRGAEKDAKMRPRLAEKYEWIVPPPNRYDPAD